MKSPSKRAKMANFSSNWLTNILKKRRKCSIILPCENHTTGSYGALDLNLIQIYLISEYLSNIMRKLDFCLCEHKGKDQLCSNCTADQRLCFHYTDSTISHLPKSEISCLYPSSVTVQATFCQTWSETRKIDFLMLRLIGQLCISKFSLISS